MDDKNPIQDYIRLLSHQLKSPINAIETLLNTIIQGYAGDLDEKTKYILQKAVIRSSEARDIITDLMDYELYDEVETVLEHEMDLTAVCKAVAMRYTATASEQNIAFHTNIPSDASIIIYGEERGIEHALRNLIENALKYTSERGSVNLTLSYDYNDSVCRVEVGDTGTGIPEEELIDIFKPFYRSLSHRSGIPGTGLGLPIVKRIVDKHQGELQIQSEVAKGSVFSIVLPYIRIEQGDGTGLERKRVVIIGGVTAGPKTAARLRRLDETLDITIVEQGEFLSYSGCGLPGYISGKVSSPRALMATGDNTVRDIDFFETIDNIRILNNTRAAAIDRDEKRIEIEDLRLKRRSHLKYDVLVLATGATPTIPPIPGIRQNGIFTLRSLEDAEAIKHSFSAGHARDVYIIGGGLIGISAAEELQDAGARITILEKKEYVLQSMLDRDMAHHISAELSRKGIKILTETEAQKVDKVGDVLRIRTSDGTFDADIIIISTGVSPNANLAKEAGLAIGPAGGIKVNSYLQTEDENIYAVGDCAESFHLATGKHEYWPLGSVSTKMGRIAADNICGNITEFFGSVGTTLFRMRDLNVGRTGLTTRTAWKEGFDVVTSVVTGKIRAQHQEDDGDYIVFKVIADKTTHKILGAQGFGRGNVAGRIEIMAAAVSCDLTLMDVFKMDLGYAPSYNNPIDLAQTGCLALQNHIDGLIRIISPDELKRKMGEFKLISVCPASSHESHMIPGSINIPLERIRSERIPFRKDVEVVLYSRTSSGAYTAYRFLKANGYTGVRVLEGGYLFWLNN